MRGTRRYFPIGPVVLSDGCRPMPQTGTGIIFWFHSSRPSSIWPGAGKPNRCRLRVIWIPRATTEGRSVCTTDQEPGPSAIPFTAVGGSSKPRHPALALTISSDQSSTRSSTRLPNGQSPSRRPTPDVGAARQPVAPSSRQAQTARYDRGLERPPLRQGSSPLAWRHRPCPVSRSPHRRR